MTIVHSVILGIVEGVTEFLPISSTAHMDLTRFLMGMPADSFIKSFEIIIQLGAILAVFILYFKKIFSSWRYFLNIVIAFIPTGIIGFLLYKIIKSFLLGNVSIEIGALLIGGIIILLFETHIEKNGIQNTEQNRVEDLTIKQLLILGTTQALAVIPGVSRSGAVIVCGRALKLNRKLIVEFSFLLAIPTMFSATLYDIYKSGLALKGSQWGIIGIGFIVSFIIALIVIKWLLNYIRRHDFNIFGWYRILIAVLMILFLVL